MNLFQILLNLHDFSDNETIYAVEPWTLESEAEVILEPATGLIHFSRDAKMFEYFLEITTAKALYQQLEIHNACTQAQCQHIIEYAIHNT